MTFPPDPAAPRPRGLARLRRALEGIVEHRPPYVGEGADGARRSALIDLDEAATFDRDDPRREERIASAAQWSRQARRLEELEGDVVDASMDSGAAG